MTLFVVHDRCKANGVVNSARYRPIQYHVRLHRHHARPGTAAGGKWSGDGGHNGSDQARDDQRLQIFGRLGAARRCSRTGWCENCIALWEREEPGGRRSGPGGEGRSTHGRNLGGNAARPEGGGPDGRHFRCKDGRSACAGAGVGEGWLRACGRARVGLARRKGYGQNRRVPACDICAADVVILRRYVVILRRS